MREHLLKEVQPLLRRGRDAAQGFYDTRPSARSKSHAAQARDWFRSALVSAEENERVDKYLTEGVEHGLVIWEMLPQKRAARFDDGWVEALQDWKERWDASKPLPHQQKMFEWALRSIARIAGGKVRYFDEAKLKKKWSAWELGSSKSSATLTLEFKGKLVDRLYDVISMRVGERANGSKEIDDKCVEYEFADGSLIIERRKQKHPESGNLHTLEIRRGRGTTITALQTLD